MKPKLLTDSISLLSPLTGIGRYTYEVSKQISLEDDFDMSYYYGYYTKNLSESSSSKDLKNKKIISKSPFLKKILRKTLMTSTKLFKPKFDIYWQPNFIPNIDIEAKKTITTVHDFSFILHKNFHPKERIEYFEKYFFKNIAKSNRIITGSEFSKLEILERLNFAEEEIEVINHGINHDIFKVYENINLPFDLPEKYIFSVGSIEPRKNLLGLLNAYNNLSENIRNEYKLVLAGFKGWNNNEIMDILKKNKKNIHYLGFISDEELAKVYNKAILFLYPSFYEGFGLPPLEAMACGTAVICSDVTSLPEVGGDAVMYCDPYDIDNIKDKIEILLNDENLQKEMIRKGLKRVKRFTWEKSAKKHSELFKKVLES